jgi:hypothetical protein
MLGGIARDYMGALCELTNAVAMAQAAGQIAALHRPVLCGADPHAPDFLARVGQQMRPAHKVSLITRARARTPAPVVIAAVA